MYSRHLRAVSFISFSCLICILALFSDLKSNVIISIAIIMLFLMIFTYIFNLKGSKLLKVAVILTIFLILPLFILLYLGILDLFPALWQAVFALIVVEVIGLASIDIIINLDVVELRFEK